jgi:hypothetical protein
LYLVRKIVELSSSPFDPLDPDQTYIEVSMLQFSCNEVTNDFSCQELFLLCSLQVSSMIRGTLNG